MPKDIEARKKTVHDLQRVVAEPAMGQSDLDELQNKVKTVVLCYRFVKERLPKDIKFRKKIVHDLQRVVAEPAWVSQIWVNFKTR